jgi:HK97 gp10 family phage protein
MAEISISGLAEFERKLKALGSCLQRDVLTAAAKAGAEIIRRDASARAPRRTGSLASNMSIRVKAGQNDANEATVEVGPSKDQFYGYFQEFGTGPNFNAAGARSIGRPGIGSGRGFTRARPFLLPALEANRDRITQAIKDAMIQAIEKAVG